MPNYTLPDFNLLCDVWFVGHFPDTDPADLFAIPCQLYLYSRDIGDVIGAPVPHEQLRVPSKQAATGWFPPMISQILGIAFPTNGDTWYYKVMGWDYVHAGFANEYIGVILYQCSAHGVLSPPSALGR